MPNGLTRIIGIGNPLMGDDGLGIEAIQLLQQQSLPNTVELIDGGCGGLKLLPLLSDCNRLIIIDAADFSAPPGSVRILTNSDLHRLPTPVSQPSGHLICLPEILHVAQKLQTLPPLTLYLMQINSCRPDNRLSNNIHAVLPALVATISNSLQG